MAIDDGMRGLRCLSALRQHRASPVSAPTILGMDAHVREAHKRNEKSAHERRVVRRNNDQGHHGHTHAGAGTHRPHLHQSSRPWMIGH